MYCTVQAQILQADTLRTLGTMRKDNVLWKNSGGGKEACKSFNNVMHNPLFESMPDDVTPLKISPPPCLHIMLGIFNSI